jgi:hypothetical protein
MIHSRMSLIAVLSAGLILAGCSSPRFSISQQSGSFTVLADQADRDTAADVADALAANSAQICRRLAVDCQFAVRVELFPDQESFDQHGMNPEMQGYYAYSGDNRIQMVSPRQPIPGVDIPYDDRVQIAVHEFVHLVLDRINPGLPSWLDEGAAIQVGPHAVYDYTCRNQFPFDKIPSLHDLEDNYASVPAADLFAYSFVNFLVGEYGIDTLNTLVRSPDRLETITQASIRELESHWHEYMDQNCSSGQE